MRYLRPLVALFLFTLSATLLVLWLLARTDWVLFAGLGAGAAGIGWLRKVEPAPYRPPAKPQPPQIPGPTQQEIELAEEEGRTGSAWIVDSEVRNEYGTTGKYELLSHVIVKIPDQHVYQTIVREFGYPKHHSRKKDTVIPIVQLKQGKPEVAVRDGVLDPDTPRAEFGYPRFWTSLYDDATFDSASLSGSVLPLIPHQSYRPKVENPARRRQLATVGVGAVTVVAGILAGVFIGQRDVEMLLVVAEAQATGTDNFLANEELVTQRFDAWKRSSQSLTLCGLTIEDDQLTIVYDNSQTDDFSRELKKTTVDMWSIRLVKERQDKCETFAAPVDTIGLSVIDDITAESLQRYGVPASGEASEGVTVTLELPDPQEAVWNDNGYPEFEELGPSYWVVNADSFPDGGDVYHTDGTFTAVQQ